MLWSQYKLATMRCSEFLRKQITGIPNMANQNSNFLTLQTSEFQKKSGRNLRNQKQNWNSAYNGGPRNRNQKLGFPTKALCTLVDWWWTVVMERITLQLCACPPWLFMLRLQLEVCQYSLISRPVSLLAHLGMWQPDRNQLQECYALPNIKNVMHLIRIYFLFPVKRGSCQMLVVCWLHSCK